MVLSREGRRPWARERGRRLPWRPSLSLIGRPLKGPAGPPGEVPGGRSVVGLGRGGPGVPGPGANPRWVRMARTSRVLDGGEDAQLAAAAGTGEDIESEHAAHQRRPRPRPRGAGGAGARIDLLSFQVGLRAPVADGLRPPARPRGEGTVRQNQVDGGPRNDGGKLLQEFDRFEEKVRRAIGGAFRHPSPSHRSDSRTEAAPLAGEGQEALEGAVGAAQTG